MPVGTTCRRLAVAGATSAPTLAMHAPIFHAGPLVVGSRRILTRRSLARRSPARAMAAATSLLAPSSGPLALAKGRLPCRRTAAAFEVVLRSTSRTGLHAVVRHASVGPPRRVVCGMPVCRAALRAAKAARTADAIPVAHDPTSTNTWREVTPELSVLRWCQWALAWELVLLQPEPQLGDLEVQDSPLR